MPQSHANALINETSPYLLQHAHNPVDWNAWGEEALARARAEKKPIFLSIGYAACHWCHVMEHESFEDEEVAELLNREFVPVKVDREERPDLDEIYMSATMLYTGGQGGWPMSVFLAPDLRPIFAGTYFPKNNAYGRPGFRTILSFIADKWKNDPDTLFAESAKVVDTLGKIHAGGGNGAEIVSAEAIKGAAEYIRNAFDSTSGGVASGSNKFPPSLSMDLLLREWKSSGYSPFLHVVELTLEKMGNGGIYDHLGGGLHRYSTDPKWLVPHFEKMLYDQGLVASIYCDGFQATDRPSLKKLCEDRACGICDYVLRDLRSPEGAFYSSEDADSEGLEGKFYVWRIEEIKELLDEHAAKIFCSHYDVSEFGNWMHPGDEHVPHGPKNILQTVRPLETIAKLDQLDPGEVESMVADARGELFEARNTRVRPGLDDKVLTGWNGLMITALAKTAFVFDEDRYAEAAAKAADFLLSELQDDGRLLATWGKGRARLTAYSTDYAFLIEGLLTLYEAGGEWRRVEEAAALADTLVEHYWDDAGGGFFFTADDHEKLLVRSKTLQDGATPSANSVMIANLLKLAVLLDRTAYREHAEAILRCFSSTASRMPFQSERFLAGADAYCRGFAEIVVVGDPADAATRALLREVQKAYLPNKITARLDPAYAEQLDAYPLFRGRTMHDGRPAAYVCRNFVCDAPVTEPAELAALLRRGTA